MLGKLIVVLAAYIADQVKAGADVIQVFDSWVGCLSVEDYRRYVLPRTTELITALQEDRRAGHLLRDRQLHSAALDERDRSRRHRARLADSARRGLEAYELPSRGAGQSRSRPLFAGWDELKQRAKNILDLANGRPGHIFNLGHGILPQTPVENVKQLAKFVQEYSAQLRGAAARNQ